MVESVHARLWVQSADCKVNFQCAWIRGHLHRCQPPLTPPLFQGQLYFEITHKYWHLMKTRSIIQSLPSVFCYYLVLFSFVLSFLRLSFSSLFFFLFRIFPPPVPPPFLALFYHCSCPHLHATRS